MKKTWTLLLVSLLYPPTTALALDAEYAIRWAVSNGGPATAKATAALLSPLSGKAKTETMKVSYFEVTRPGDAPSGFTASLRERVRLKGTETTWKYRKAAVLPASAIDKWRCPLPGTAEFKEEVDISVVKGTVKAAISGSCTVAGTVAKLDQTKFKPVKKGCTASMTRIKTDELTIENGSLTAETC